MKSNINNSLVVWPEWWPSGKKGFHFLEGIPFVGPHVKMVKEIRKKLDNRDELAYLDAWNKIGFDPVNCHVISEKAMQSINDLIRWPNYFFFPEDQVSLLLGLIPGVIYDYEDILKSISKRFNLPLDEHFLKIIFENEYKDFIIYVNNNSKILDKKSAR